MDTTKTVPVFRAFPFAELLRWQEHYHRDHLPWRDLAERSDQDRAYRVWLSEILLQQTQAERVAVYFARIIEAFPTVQALAETDYETFFDYYKWLGYYSRARNLLATAKKIAHEMNGIFPRESKELTTLPWVGAYTAEAIRAFAWDMPTLALDTNLVRVFRRYYAGSRFIDIPTDFYDRLIDQMVAESYSGRRVNAALMDFGATISTASKSGIDFGSYPLPDCKFAKTRGSLEISVEKTRKTFPIADAKRIIVLHENHQKYLSTNPTSYEPFSLLPEIGDFRHGVQRYFNDTYGLAVSVRPVRWHSYQWGAPYALANAQVQTWMQGFIAYDRAAFLAWQQTFFDACDHE